MYFVIIIAIATGETVVASSYMNIRSIVIIYNYFKETILVFWRGRRTFDRVENDLVLKIYFGRTTYFIVRFHFFRYRYNTYYII